MQQFIEYSINTIKGLIAGFISGAIVYFDPVAGKLKSLMALFILNALIGYIAGRVANNEEFSLKKFANCFTWAAAILLIICAFYYIGEHNGDQEGTLEALHITILVAIWAFGTNILRNLCNLSKGNKPVHKLFYAGYYWLSFDFVRRIPILAELTGHAPKRPIDLPIEEEPIEEQEQGEQQDNEDLN